MSRHSEFRYPLEPVLLKRKWDLDALLLDLRQVNEAIAKLKEELAALRNNIESSAAEWKQRAGEGLSVDNFSVLTNYMKDLATQQQAVEQEIARQEGERDVLIERVALAQRGVEAAEQHRDEMKAEFVKLRLSQDFKFADDHWSTLQTRAEKHDIES